MSEYTPMNEYIPGVAVRVLREEDEWWLNAADLSKYLRDVSDEAQKEALTRDNEMEGFGIHSIGVAVGRFADALDVTLIEAATREQHGG